MQCRIHYLVSSSRSWTGNWAVCFFGTIHYYPYHDACSWSLACSRSSWHAGRFMSRGFAHGATVGWLGQAFVFGMRE